MENTTTTTIAEEVETSTVESSVEQASALDRRYLRPREIAGFLLTSFGQKNLSQYVNAFRQFFAISFLGMSGSTYGLIMFIETIYDAVDDSISGLIIDRTRTRWGRLRPWLVIPTPFWAIAMLMLFTTPSFLVHEWQKVIWTIVAIFVYIGPAGEELAIAYREKLPYLGMLIMLVTAHIAATASFKAPFLQARVAMIAALMSIGFQIWLAVDIFRFLNEMTFHITALFPLAAAVLNFMAAKRALVEEMTIKAFKSLRSKRR